MAPRERRPRPFQCHSQIKRGWTGQSSRRGHRTPPAAIDAKPLEKRKPLDQQLIYLVADRVTRGLVLDLGGLLSANTRLEQVTMHSRQLPVSVGEIERRRNRLQPPSTSLSFDVIASGIRLPARLRDFTEVGLALDERLAAG